MLIRVIAGAALLAACSATIASAKDKSVALRDKQQAACYDDVQKFCKDAIPDEDKVKACMQDKRSMVSAQCAAMWDVKD